MGTPADSARYLPGDDTRLLKEALRPFSGRACLEIGFGSGAVVASVSKKFEAAVGTDVIGLSDARLALAPGVDLVLADGAECFRKGSFDLVFFNPPYLPSSRIEDRSTDGGPTGIEVPMAFLEGGLRVLREGGVVMVLLSDEGDLGAFVARCRALGLEARRVVRRRLFYENLVVFRVERSAVKAKAKRRRRRTDEGR